MTTRSMPPQRQRSSSSMQNFATKKLSPASEANGPSWSDSLTPLPEKQDAVGCFPGLFTVRADLIELFWPASAAARPVGHTNDRRQVAFSGARRPSAELPAPEAPGPLTRTLSLRLNLKA